mmetsp:Transcript_72879/g.126527  ORF Transcript_72879/g.126527 Transcript_72879/m.126527 type:complete len:130 (-) Transcript_72879:72-461(-)
MATAGPTEGDVSVSKEEPSGDVAPAEEAHEPSFWEILDELIHIDIETLKKILAGCLGVLLIIVSVFMHGAVREGNWTHIALFGGFFLLIFGLVGSVIFVLTEVAKIKSEEAAGTTKESAAEDTNRLKED